MVQLVFAPLEMWLIELLMCSAPTFATLSMLACLANVMLRIAIHLFQKYALQGLTERSIAEHQKKVIGAPIQVIHPNAKVDQMLAVCVIGHLVAHTVNHAMHIMLSFELLIIMHLLSYQTVQVQQSTTL